MSKEYSEILLPVNYISFSRFDPQDLATIFCTAIREILPRKDQPPNQGVTLLKPGPGHGNEALSNDIESSWANLFRYRFI